MTDEPFEVVTETDSATIVTSASADVDVAELERTMVANALKYYDPENKQYSEELSSNASPSQPTLDQIDSYGKTAQTNISTAKTIIALVKQQINVDDLIGMVYQSIEANINPRYRLSFAPPGTLKKQKKRVERAEEIIRDFNEQVNLGEFIKNAICDAYSDGTLIYVLRRDESNWVINNYPLGIAELSSFSVNGQPIVLVNMDELKGALDKTILKTRKGKPLFFSDTATQIRENYPKEVYDAYRAGEKYAKLDVAYTGVVRVNNRGSKYGVSPIFRAMKPSLMLDNYQKADAVNAKARGKKIIHQIMREKLLGADGTRKALDDMAFAHGELMKAWRNPTVVYTSCPAVEAVKYVEPEAEDTAAEKLNLYRNRVLSSLGVSFLTNDNTQTSATAKLSLGQLMRTINMIARSVAHMIEGFYITVLRDNGIGMEYAPSFEIDESELLDIEMRMELAKLLYSTFCCSRGTSMGVLGIDVEDEARRRRTENDANLDDVFTPYGTAYTKSADDNQNTGRPADTDSSDPDKQLDDQERYDES